MKDNIKTIVTTGLLFLICNLMQAQDCGTLLLQQQVDYMNQTRDDRVETKIELLTGENEKIYLQVVTHLVRDGNGQNGLSLEQLETAMEQLNLAFDKTILRFNLCEINYIDNQAYFERIDYNSSEVDLAEAHIIPNKINIFFTPDIYMNNDTSSLCGWAYYPSHPRDWIMMANRYATSRNTLAHEIGHYFNLYHTFQGNSVIEGVEHWADELVNQSNCGPNVGDEVCDTPADPTGKILHNKNTDRYQIGYCTDIESCEFSDSLIEFSDSLIDYGCKLTDENGDQYKPDTKNIMSYNYGHCRTQFSGQQIVRMEKSYFFDRDYLSKQCEVNCENLLVAYDWLSEMNCTNIIIYKKDEDFNYLVIENETGRNLYLSNGALHCPGKTVDNCIKDLGLNEIIATCNLPCKDICNDPNACNYGAAEFCDYGFVDCQNPCDENSCYGCTNVEACNYNEHAIFDNNTCHFSCLPDCNTMEEEYPWLKEKIDYQLIKEYRSLGGWEYIEVQYNNDMDTLYFENGVPYCNNESLEGCIVSYNLTEVLSKCVTKNCTVYGCTDETASNYNEDADCDNNSCTYVCVDTTACNYGKDEPCKYGNAACENPCDESSCNVYGCTYLTACNYNPEATIDDGSCNYGNAACEDPCDESTCQPAPNPNCEAILAQYPWIKNEVSGVDYSIKIYPYCDELAFVEIQSGDNQTLYLSQGVECCVNEDIENCKVQLGLMEAAEEYYCGSVTPPNCANYTGTVFYEDCGGTNWRFIITDAGQIFDPYFDLVDLQVYDGQHIKFDFIDNTEQITPCETAEKAISITCLEEIDMVVGTCDDVFSVSDIASTIVDKENCNGENIIIYTYSEIYQYTYIFTDGAGQVYYDGALWASDDGDRRIAQTYGFKQTATWTCGCDLTNSSAKTNGLFENTKTKATNKYHTFQLFPNPTKGQVQIILNDEPESEHKVSIFDISGKLVQQHQFASQQISLDVNGLSKGMYIVEIQNTENAESTNTQGKQNTYYTQNTQKLFIE